MTKSDTILRYHNLLEDALKMYRILWEECDMSDTRIPYEVDEIAFKITNELHPDHIEAARKIINNASGFDSNDTSDVMLFVNCGKTYEKSK